MLVTEEVSRPDMSWLNDVAPENTAHAKASHTMDVSRSRRGANTHTEAQATALRCGSQSALIPPIRLVAPCRAIPLPAWFVSGFGERASVPRLGFGLGRIWVLRVSLPLSIYHSCV